MGQKGEDKIRYMAELLKRGATLLNETCPECKTLLFREGDRIFCPNCDRRVVIVKDQEEITHIYHKSIISDVFEALFFKLKEIIPEITKDKEHQRMELLTYLKELLECMQLLTHLTDKKGKK
ncbi:MAG: Sjogren's syndrome/scleroderma autoantigen 1 family protein [Candidatus Hodarchaeota archaeon]